MRKTLATILVLCASLAQAQLLEALLYGQENVKDAQKNTVQELIVRGDYLSASRSTGELVASGGVTAVASPYRFRADRVPLVLAVGSQRSVQVNDPPEPRRRGRHPPVVHDHP